MAKAKKKKPDNIVAILLPKSGSVDPADIRGAMEKWDNADEMSDTVKDQLSNDLSAYLKRRPPPRVMVEKNDSGGVVTKQYEGQTEQQHIFSLMRCFGTASVEFMNDCLNDLCNHIDRSNNRGVSTQSLNAALAYVDGLDCVNEMEAKLAIQMFMTADAASRASAMLGGCTMVDQFNSMGNLTTKMMRTHIAQAEAMAKLRRGGEQVVKYIHIDNRNGGQAVVAGNVQTGGQNEKTGNQPHATDGKAPIGGSAMLSENKAGNGVPISSREGESALQNARGQ